MDLIIGGVCQGKGDFVKERYKLEEADICYCRYRDEEGELLIEAGIDFTKGAIHGLEHFIRWCLHNGIEAKDYLEKNKEIWQEKVLICTDLSSGIVPLEKELREWREMVGRTMVYLGKEAEEVTRLFCGIPQRLK